MEILKLKDIAGRRRLSFYDLYSDIDGHPSAAIAQASPRFQRCYRQ